MDETDREMLVDGFLANVWAKLIAGEGFLVRNQLNSRKGHIFGIVKQALREEGLVLAKRGE